MHIDEARAKINEIDEKMAELFECRMTMVDRVSQFKKENNLPVLDSKRERFVVEKNLDYIKSPEYKPFYEEFIKHTMSLSRCYQAQKQLAHDELITVSLKDKSYNILLKRGCLSHVFEHINLNRRVLILTDDGVPSEYAKCVLAQCPNGFVEVIPQGEGSKSFKAFERICTKLLELEFSRKDLIIGLGGGVVLDLAGFVAASFMRGIELCNIPTTTISQIDSSIGGKTAINLNGIKNIVGAFYQPSVVLIDSDTLKTLPKRHFNNGLIEALKAGLIWDKSLYELFFSEGELDIDKIIYRSLIVKKTIVQLDEKEQGLRQILNFGHTLGHALESLCGLSKLLHGEAVAIGMLPMLGTDKLKSEVKSLCDRLCIDCNLEYDKQKAYEIMVKDKKSNGNKITIVVVNEVGNAELCEIEKTLLRG